MSLYRKHRPQKFMDLIGQDHIKTTLSNALGSQKFSHAYLFNGPKGSGKTTTARLLAKALNCTGRELGLDSFEPCDKCLSCQEITGGHSMDVMEIDAASNRGIDEIRELRDKIRFAPSSSKFKVYVIDECHMLTKEAFNALLKTLEEPPAHAVFILATTELHKVPATILSRVQTFDFKKAKPSEIMALLEKTAQKEKIQIELDALTLISKLAFGAYRDALTMLDQVTNLESKDKITLQDVQRILGQTTEEEVWLFVELLAKKERKKLIELINNLYFEGKDLENFLGGVVLVLRKLILQKSGFSDLAEPEEKKVAKLADLFTTEELVLAIERFIEAMPKTKMAVLGQLPIEMVLFEIIKEENLDLVQEPIKKDLIERKVERKVESKIEIKKEPLKSDPVIDSTAQSESVEVAEVQSGDLAQAWPKVVSYAKTHNNSLAALLKDAVYTGTEDGKIILTFKYKFHADQICNHKYRQIIDEAFLKTTGKAYEVQCLVDPKLKIDKPIDHDEKLLTEVKEIFE